MTTEEVREVSKIIFGEPIKDEDFKGINLKKFIEETNKKSVKEFFGIDTMYAEWLRPHIICEDDTEISVQASTYHYCTPRMTSQPAYETYEVCLYDTDLEESLKIAKKKKYKEAIQWFIDNDGDSVYSQVPHNIVQNFIDFHGGIKELKHHMTHHVFCKEDEE